MRRFLVLSTLLCSLLIGTNFTPSAEAQVSAELGTGGLDLHLFRPAVDSKGYLTVNGTDILGNGDFSSAIGNGGVSFDWSADYASGAVNVQIAFVDGNQILWTETLASVGTGWNAYDFAFDPTTAWMMTDNTTSTTNSFSDVFTASHHAKREW